MMRKQRLQAILFGSILVLLIGIISYMVSAPPSVLGAQQAVMIQPIAVNAPFAVDFSSWMNKEQTAKAVRIEPELAGTFSWEGNTLLYTPTEELIEGSTYTLTVSQEARDLLGKQLQEPYSITYTVTAAPQIQFASPENIIVEPAQPITIMFSSPMVSLSALDTPDLGEVQLEIHPDTKGSIRWIDTQTIQFRADNGLIPSSHYVVTVKAGSRSQDGGMTKEDYQFTFDTPAPAIISTTPEEGYALAGPPSPITLQFNQEMNLKSLEEALVISPDTDVQLSYDPKDPTAVVITPNPAWAFTTPYEITIPAGVRGTQGEKTMTDPYTLHFNTVGTPALLSSDPANEELSASVYGFTLEFNTPIPENGLAGHVEITPALEQFTVVHEEGNSIYIDANFAYSTSYTVRITKGLKDIYGQTLAEDISYTFTTTDRPRSISINKQDRFSMFSSYEPVIYEVKTVNLSGYSAGFCSIALSTFLNGDHGGDTPCDTTRTDITVSGEKNLVTTTQLDFAALTGAPLQPGIYYLEVQAKEIKEEDWRHTDRVYFFVSDTALSLKHDEERLVVWATDLREGTPTSNVSLELYQSGQRIAEGTTNDDGLYTFTTTGDSYEQFYVVARRNNTVSIASTYWDSGIAPWEFDISQTSTESPFVGYLYSERPIYRPGDTVYLKGMVRFDNDAFYELPTADTKINLTISNPEYDSVKNIQTTLTSNGTFTGEFVLPSDASVGQYHMEWQVNDHYLKNGGYRAFFVEEYRRPEFQVQVETPKTSIINGEDIQAQLAASYFFGGPLSNASYTWTLQKTNYFFDGYTDGWFNFSGDEAYQYCSMGACADESSIVTQGSGTLNEAGKTSLTIPLTGNKDTTSKLYTLEVTVTDTNAQSFSSRVTIPWHIGTYYIGMKNDRYVVNAKEEATFELITVDTAGAPIGNKAVSVEFFQRAWHSVKKQNVDGNFYWETETKDTPVGTKTTTTAADGSGTISFIPTSGGYYVAKATAKDERGNTITSMAGVYVADDSYTAWNQGNNNRLELIADKTSYEIGDTAKVLIPSPFTHTTALVTYERGGIFHTEVLKLPSSSHTLSVPITEEFVPNTFISVILIKDMSMLEEGAERVPEFRVGYKNLMVSPKEKELHLSLTTEKERYQPGETVSITVITKDHKGTPIDAEVALGVVDASVLALKGNPKEALLEEFYYERGLGVSTASNLTVFMDTINVNGKGAKGGGGGDDALAQKKRGEFKDTAYWNPTITTTNGSATISFTLPDNLTTWHIVGLGITKDTLVGNTEKDIVATKDVLVRPVLPRFFRFQDRITIGAIVHNFTDKEQTFTVGMEGTNIDTKTAMERPNIKIKAGESELITWSVQVTGDMYKGTDSSTITLRAHNNSYEDTVSTTLPIRSFASPETVAFFGTTEESAAETIMLPNNTYRTFGKLEVLLSNTLVTSLQNPLQALFEYDYTSTETIASQLQAFAIRTSLTNAGFGELFSGDTMSDATVNQQLPKLYQAQRSDGGWGYWYGSSRSYPYISAHVIEALALLRSTGHSINEEVLTRGQAYLSELLRNPKLSSDYGYGSTERAYMLYVLTTTGAGDTNLVNNLFETRTTLSLEGTAYLVRTLQYLQDDRSNTLLTEVLAQGLQDAQARYVHFSDTVSDKRIMSSDTRTTAIIAQALLAQDTSHPLLPKIILWLQHRHTNQDRISTQDTLHTLEALAAYVTSTTQTSPTLQVRTSLNEQELATTTLSKEQPEQLLSWPLNTLTVEESVRSMFRMTVSGDSPRLYYQGILSYTVPAQEIAPRNAGFAVQRAYYALNDTKSERPVTFATQGDTLRGKVTVVVPADRYNVAVEIPLPAGFEGVNFNLDTSQQALQEQLENNQMPWWYESAFTHTEVRDDRIVLFADHLTPGVYDYEYFVNVTNQGIFNHPPTIAYEQYYPEVFGRSKGTLWNVR